MTDERPEVGGSDSPRCYRAACEGACPIVHTLPDRPQETLAEMIGTTRSRVNFHVPRPTAPVEDVLSGTCLGRLSPLGSSLFAGLP
jgi:hypothetical protein